jgi:hypothetical protein
MLTCRVILVINCFQLFQRRQLLLPPGAALTMASEKECTSHAAECVQLAGLTDDLTVRDQLLDLAQEWMLGAQQGRRRSDGARVVPLNKNQDDNVVPLHKNQDEHATVDRQQTKPVPPRLG